MSADGINSFRDGLSAAANGATDPLGRQGEWLKCKLADVVEKIETGKNIIAGSGRSRFRILKVSAVTTGVYAEQESKPAPDRFEPDTRSIVRVGDFLFSRANTAELVGATALVDSTDGNTLLPDKLWRVVWTDRVDPTFMLYMLHSAEMRLAISREATGTSASMRNVSQLKFLGIPVSLPSLSEQHRIVDILDRAAAIQKLRKEAEVRAKEILPALFADMFGDPEQNPGKWPERALENLVSEFRYGTSQKSGPTGLPVLRIPNVLGGRINTDEIKLVDLGDKEQERLRLRDGDLLFVRTNGNPDYVGRSAVFEAAAMDVAGYDGPNTAYASYLIRCRLKDDVSPHFLQGFLSSIYGRQKLREQAKTSAGQYNINIAGLSGIKVILPPLKMQREFARRVEAIASVEKVGESASSVATSIQASLLARLVGSTG